MSLLSTVPRVIIIAMQVALVSLVLLATVPIAMGGVDVDVTKDPEIKYNDYSVEFSMEMVIDTNLYFDLTGFRYSVSLTSGGHTLSVVPETDLGTIKHTTVTINGEIPLTTLAMMMVYGAASDTDTVMTVAIRGSTLMGMITADVKVNTVITDAVSGDVTVNADGSELSAVFTVPEGAYDLFDDIYDDIFGSGPIAIVIGGVEITIDATLAGGSYTFTVDVTCSSGSTILADLEAALAAADADGNITITINGVTYTLTKAEVEFIIGMLKIMMEEYL